MKPTWETKKIPLTLEQLEALANVWPELKSVYLIAALAPESTITIQIKSKKTKTPHETKSPN